MYANVAMCSKVLAKVILKSDQYFVYLIKPAEQKQNKQKHFFFLYDWFRLTTKK